MYSHAHLCFLFSRYWAKEYDYERTVSSIQYGGLIERDQTYNLPELAPKALRRLNKNLTESDYTLAEKAKISQKDLLPGQTVTGLAKVSHYGSNNGRYLSSD
jgi:hypothetical protein